MVPSAPPATPLEAEERARVVGKNFKLPGKSKCKPFIGYEASVGVGRLVWSGAACTSEKQSAAVGTSMLRDILLPADQARQGCKSRRRKRR